MKLVSPGLAVLAALALAVVPAWGINFQGEATYALDAQGALRVCWPADKECITFTRTGERGMCDDVRGSFREVVSYLKQGGTKGTIQASFEMCIRGPGYMGMLCVGRETSYNYCGYVKGR